ncbi:MAG TPA: hypothetical protein VNH44_09760 [Micropepsaceae bacterium]|nr:hypothetical protein [Micropepsaceae bacterium]
MSRAVAYLSGQKASGRKLAFDGLRVLLFTVHLAVIGYVGLGWLIPSRGALFFYALLLPTIVMQWLLNGGASIVNNVENLARTGHWNDASNNFEGTFFKTVLRAGGVHASQAQITTALCGLMLIFWIAAVCHMVLVVAPPA